MIYLDSISAQFYISKYVLAGYLRKPVKASMHLLNNCKIDKSANWYETKSSQAVTDIS